MSSRKRAWSREGKSLPVQSNSAVAEFDMFSAEIGQARFRMEGGALLRAGWGLSVAQWRPTRPRYARPPSPKTGGGALAIGRDSSYHAASVGKQISIQKQVSGAKRKWK